MDLSVIKGTMVSGSNIFSQGTQETNVSQLPFETKATSEPKGSQGGERFSLISDGTPSNKDVPNFSTKNDSSANSAQNANTDKFPGLQDSILTKASASLNYLRHFLKENGLDNSPILNFLRKEKLTTPNESIQEFLGNNPFMQQALNSDLNSFMNRPVPIRILAQMFDIKETPENSPETKFDANETTTPFAFLKSLGIDPHLVMAKVFQLKHIFSSRNAAEPAPTSELTAEKGLKVPRAFGTEKPSGTSQENAYVGKEPFAAKEKQKKTELNASNPSANLANNANVNPGFLPNPISKENPKPIAVENDTPVARPKQTSNINMSKGGDFKAANQVQSMLATEDSKMTRGKDQNLRESIETLLKNSPSTETKSLQTLQANVITDNSGNPTSAPPKDKDTSPELENLLNKAERPSKDRFEDFWNLDKAAPKSDSIVSILNAKNQSIESNVVQDTGTPKNVTRTIDTESKIKTETLSLAPAAESRPQSTTTVSKKTPETNKTENLVAADLLTNATQKSEKNDDRGQEFKEDRKQETKESQKTKQIANAPFIAEKTPSVSENTNVDSPPANQVSKHVVEHAKVLVAKGGGSVVIDLPHDGPEKVSLAIKVDGQSASLKILTSSAEMKNILGQDLDHLKQSLSNMKISLDHYEVNSVPREQLSHFFQRNFQDHNPQQRNFHSFSSQRENENSNNQNQRPDFGPLSRIAYNASKYIPSYSRFQTAV